MRHASEPTVEEILESIKKVIARDSRSDAVEQRRRRETHGVVATPVAAVEDDHAADVLDLADDGPFTLAEAEDAYEDEEAYLDAAYLEDADDVPETPLLTENARTSMQESLAALAMLAQPGMAPQIVRSGETSLEGLARDLLRPALAEWLDKNLPPMVERMVASEIARIVGKKG